MSYIPGAPSYVRQDINGEAFALPMTDTGKYDGTVGSGAPSYLKMGQDGKVHVEEDHGLPVSLTNNNTSPTGKQTAAEIANNPDINKVDPQPTPSGKEELKSQATKQQEEAAKKEDEAKRLGEVGGYSGAPYAPTGKTSNWAKGSPSKIIENTGVSTKETWPQVQRMSSSMFAENAAKQTPTYREVNPNPSEESTVPAQMQRYRVYEAKYKTSWQEEGRKKEMLNRDLSQIQNEYGFPKYLGTREDSDSVRKQYEGSSYTSNGLGKYDYRFIPGQGPSKNIEDLLSKVRMQYGIQVHGNPNLERNVLYYMYNRFKSPDWGLAHNKTFTHVFFTRPDLYLMESANQIADQLSKHSEMTMIYRRHPDLVRLLCNGKKMGDGNNFNMLLSNRCTSFPMTPEGLSKLEVGKSWNDHKMVYGDGYTGRFAGEFSCTFNETSDYSIINLIKLWITYIDNVSRGAMTPYYGPRNGGIYGLNIPDDYCHVHHKALDYASSAYVFKVGPDGSDILYWSKYYGVFPISTGTSALSWESGQEQGTPRLDITFAYSYKLDLNPISLLEFNDNAGIQGNTKWISSYDPYLPGSARPFVGSPFVEFIDYEPEIVSGSNHIYNTDHREIEGLRLRFKKDESRVRSDDLLFKAYGSLNSNN